MTDRTVDFEKGDGLVPAIVQDACTGRVLMMGYMNRESFIHTRESGKVTFFSRSRQKLWTKGETSGNFLELVDISIDCDGDTLLVKAIPNGPTCHTGNESCFDLEPEMGWRSISEAVGGLSRVIAKRKDETPEGSYTAELIKCDTDQMARALGKEALEVILAAKDGDKESVIKETADLLYHTMVLLARMDISPDRVASELSSRRK